MTTIAFKDGKFAWDSVSTFAGKMKIESNDKVFQNGPLTFGVSGNARMNNILKYMKVPPMPHDKEGWNLEKWVVKVLVPEMRKEAKAAGYSDDEDAVLTRNAYLLYVQGEAFLIGSDLYIKKLSGPFAVGSGASFAIGAMRAGATAEEAVQIACEFDSASGGAVNTQDMNDLKGTVND